MDWNRGHPIGHGSSATVSLATMRNGEIFAVKSSELSCSEPLKKEQKILSSLCCPYVVTYKGCDITTENNKLMYNLLMEYMPFGNLVQLTHRNDGRLDEATIVNYTRQVVKGLDHLHSNGLIHCDIKGANILISKDGAKIGDFGCAKTINEAAAVKTIGGTPMFMAPEVARGEEQGCASDIWSLGCTVIEMATGASPWPNLSDPISMLYHLAYSDVVPKIPCFLSNEAKDFLEKCFRRNPKERWTASELLKHPLLCSNDAKQVVESNSCSPTSILEQGFWSFEEESENLISIGNLIHSTRLVENFVGDRVRMLAACSGEPCWAWHDDDDDDDDESWITIRGNEVDVYGNCGSETGSSSTSDDGLVKSNVRDRISGHFFQDHIHMCRNANVVVSSLNFEAGVDQKMLLPSTLDCL